MDKKMSEKAAKNRIVWIDLIRICAIVLVVLCHATEGIYKLDVDSVLALNTADKILVFTCFTIGRLGVPLFLMISGWLLLDRKYDRQAMKRFWKNSWLHLIACALVWFLLYDLIPQVSRGCTHTYGGASGRRCALCCQQRRSTRTLHREPRAHGAV